MLAPQTGQNSRPIQRERSAADQLGFWSAATVTVVGVIYVVVLAVLAVAGQFVMPPSQPVQLFGAVVTILMAPILVVLMACIHLSVSEARRAFSLSALTFTVLFAAMVSINRYVQLTVIR